MAGWIDAQTLSEFVKANLAQAPSATLKPHWDTIIAASLTGAYSEILSSFNERGFTKAQVDQWDRGTEFQRDHGAWLALRRMQILQPGGYDDKALAILDRRLDLRGDKTKDWPAVPLTIAGVPQDPGGTYGQAAVGSLDTSGDMFVLPTACEDSRIGQTTRF